MVVGTLRVPFLEWSTVHGVCLLLCTDAMDKNKMESQQRTILNYIKSCQKSSFRHAVYHKVTSLTFIVMCLLALLHLVNRYYLFPFSLTIIIPICIICAIGLGIFVAIMKRISLTKMAGIVDTNRQLKGRVITALELIQDNRNDRLVDLQIRDTAKCVENADAKMIIPNTMPKYLKWLPIPLLIIGLSFAIPRQYELPDLITKYERDAINQTVENLTVASNMIQNTHLQNQITKTINLLQNAKYPSTVNNVLSDLNTEIRKEKSVYPDESAITLAVQATQHFKNMDTNALAEELERLAKQQELPPELLTELNKLYAKLTENMPQSELKHKLDQIQGTTVSSDVLQEIANALKHANRLNQLENMLLEDRKQIALAGIKTDQNSGGLAQSNGAPGQETGNTEVKGSQETNINSDFTPTANGNTPTKNGNTSSNTHADGNIPPSNYNGNALEINAENASATENITRVFTGRVSNDSHEPGYLPFSHVVLAAQQGYANAIENNGIPARYRNKIKAYLTAIANIDEKQTD